jgi:O-antigen ligase
MFLDRPLVGCGLGQYKQHHIDYLKNSDSSLPLERAKPYVQHNVLLALLTETGLIGAGLFASLFAFWFRDAWQLLHSKTPGIRSFGVVYGCMVFVYLFNGMFHDVSIIPMVHVLLFLLAGMARSLAVTEQASRITARRATPAVARRTARTLSEA